MPKLSLVLLLGLLVGAAIADQEILSVSRLVQFDQGTQQLGSRKVSLDLLASVSTAGSESLSRQIIVLPIGDLSFSSFSQLIESRQPGGILFLIPESLTTEQRTEWNQIQAKLLSQSFTFPIYFAKRGEAEERVYQQLLAEEKSRGSASTDETRLVVVETDPKTIKGFNLVNIQGWLAGAQGNNTGDSVPTIAIVANYDSFAVAPELAIGANSNAGGVAGLFQLARVFSRLYKNPRTQGSYNLLFLATTGGRLNFAGSKYFLENAEARVLDSLELVVCLDSIASADNELYLHVSRPPKDPQTKAVYNTFTVVAQELKIKFEVVQQKINISDPNISWEHEQYSRKKIMAGTLSSLAQTSLTLAERSNLFDTVLSAKSLAKSVQLVAEVIARIVYDIQQANLHVFEGSNAPEEQFLQSWVDALTASHRMVPFLDAKSPVISSLETGFNSYLSDVSKQSFKFSGDVVFYNSTKSSMAAYKGKPITFDLFLAAGVAIYLGGMYTILMGVSATIQQVKDLISRKKKKTS